MFKNNNYINNTFSFFCCHHYSFLFVLSFSIFFTNFIKSETDNQMAIEMLQDPVTVEEMRLISNVYLESLDVYKEFNFIEERSSEVSDMYLNKLISQNRFLSDIDDLILKNKLVYKNFIENPPLISNTPKSNFKSFRSYYFEAYYFIKDLRTLYEEIHLNIENLLISAKREDWVLYDDYSSISYIKGAELTKKSLNVQKSALKISPKESIANKLVSIELVLTEILTEFNKLQGLILKSSSMNIAKSIEIVRNNVKLLENDLENESENFFQFVDRFFIQFNDPEILVFFPENFNSDLQLLRSLSVKLANANIKMGRQYVYMIDIYYENRFNLESVSESEIEALNLDMFQQREYLSETLLSMQNQFRLVQDQVIEVLGNN